MNNIRTSTQTSRFAAISVATPAPVGVGIFFVLVGSLLTGCGGGSGADVSTVNVIRSDGSSVAVTAVSPPSAVVPERVTIPEYKALRASVVTVTGGAVPDAATLAGLTTANQRFAAAQVQADLSAEANALVVPPLTQAVLRSLASAASGDTLGQITSLFEVTASPTIAAYQTDRVASQWWADKGFRLRTAFLAAPDTLGPFPRLAQWAADEAGFSDGSAAAVPALANFLDNQNRAAVSHSLAGVANWPAVTAFNGIFDTASAPNDLRRMPMVKIIQGVERFVGVDFTADALVVGDLRLMTIRPAGGKLADFSADQLASALAQSAQLRLPGAAITSPGEMVLPKLTTGLPFVADAPIKRAGVNLAYDEVNANLRNLDGVGGTYATASSTGSTLSIAEGELRIAANQSLAYRFSRKNIYGPTDGSYSYSSYFIFPFTGNISSICIGTVVWPQPDLRSFFLVLMDARHWVVSMAAIHVLAGDPVEPTCIPAVTETVAE